MALGEAFIEVHADLRPFVRDLDRQVKNVADRFEKQLSVALTNAASQASEAGVTIGRDVGEGVGTGIRNQFTGRNHPWYISLASGLASALDDGISALPTELKAAIAAGLLTITPLVIGGLGAAIAAAVGVGVAGVGVALATQFLEVRVAAQRSFLGIRESLLFAAEGFSDVLVDALERIATFADDIAPQLREIFDQASTFIDPLLDGLIGGIRFFLDSLSASIGPVGDFVDELGNSIKSLGQAVGLALEILAGTGEEGRIALRDLTAVVAALIVAFASLVAGITEAYGWLRNFAQDAQGWVLFLSPLLSVLHELANGSDALAGENRAVWHSNQEVERTAREVAVAAELERETMERLAEAVTDAANATLDAIQANVDYERSFDRLQEALEAGGRNLEISTKEGQDSIEAYRRALSDLGDQLRRRVEVGDLTTAEAIRQYRREIREIKELGNAVGITDGQFNRLFGSAVALGELSIDPDHSGIDATAQAVENLTAEINQAVRRALALAKAVLAIVPFGSVLGFGLRGFADGDIITQPTLGLMGEAGPEVVIPLTKPARAAQLARESGLDQILSMGSTQVLVFIGNEQLDARMVRIVERSNATQGLMLTQGFRGL